LLTIEAAMMPGKGRMTVTGNLRDVDEGSRSRRRRLTCAPRARSPSASSRPCLGQRDIHVHVPEGATAEGWTLCRRRHGYPAIVSVMTGVPVRRDPPL